MLKYSPRVLNLLKSNPSFSTPEDIVIHLAKELAAKVPNTEDTKKRLAILASYRGIIAINYKRMQEEESGTLINNAGNRNEILVNNGHSINRQNFTIAHEICHTFFTGPTGNENSNYSDYCEDPYEEKLCDIGASEILFFNCDFSGRFFSIDTLIKTAEKFTASYEATAIKMVKSNIWRDVGFIIWKKKVKKDQNLDQSSFWQGYEDKEVFRVQYSYFNNYVYIPQNKSVNNGSAIDIASSQGLGKGVLQLNLDPVHILNVEAICIYKNTVLSLVTSLNGIQKPRKVKIEDGKAELF